MIRVLPILVILAVVAGPRPAYGDEADNFTCRPRPLRDSLAALDDIMNARIEIGVARANARLRKGGCDEACFAREMQAAIGGAYLHPLTGIPHSRFERWIAERDDVDRCRVRFRDSIYGARPYNQPWLFPFTGRIILIADSIRVSGTLVGIDKINHFIREGLGHWKDAQKGRTVEEIMQAELGAPRRQFRWNEYGLKGWSLTGVLAYADLAASYAGLMFWSDISATGRPTSYVSRDDAAGPFSVRRRFTFAAYVNDAWDEGINCSVFTPGLAREVSERLAALSMTCPAPEAPSLASLPDAGLYVNPRYLITTAMPDVQ